MTKGTEQELPLNRAFYLAWPGFMETTWNKNYRLHKTAGFAWNTNLHGCHFIALITKTTSVTPCANALFATFTFL